MVDLTLPSGLPIKFDDLTEKFQYGENIRYQNLNRIPLTSMLPGLLNKSLRYPETVYTEHKNIHLAQDDSIFSNSLFNYDLLMLPSGVMGVEFIRTHVFYSEICDDVQASLSEIVEVLSGTLTVLLQRNTPKLDPFEFETKVSEGLVVKLTKGEKFSVPKGYFYTFINNRPRPVVFSRFYNNNCHSAYGSFSREQGLAYYAIRKNAKQEIVLNPRYREIPQIRKTAPEQIQYKAKPTLSKEPLYNQIISQASLLCELF